MSYHIYIAREGFKENPIPNDVWLAAAHRCEELVIKEEKNRENSFFQVRLKSDRRAKFSRTPYGVIDVQDPTKEQMRVVFKLSAILDAGVYSDELYRYMSLEDWDGKTRSNREKMFLIQKKSWKKRHIKISFFVLIFIACSIIGYFK